MINGTGFNIRGGFQVRKSRPSCCSSSATNFQQSKTYFLNSSSALFRTQLIGSKIRSPVGTLSGIPTPRQSNLRRLSSQSTNASTFSTSAHSTEVGSNSSSNGVPKNAIPLVQENKRDAGFSSRSRLKPIAAVSEVKHLPFFSQYPLDRKVEWRRDSEILKQALSSPQSRLILTYKSEMLVAPYISPFESRRGPSAENVDFFSSESDTSSSSNAPGLLQPLYLRPASVFAELLAGPDSVVLFLGLDRSGAPYFATEVSETVRRLYDNSANSGEGREGGVAALSFAPTSPSMSTAGAVTKIPSTPLEAVHFLRCHAGADWKPARNVGPRMPAWDAALAAAASSLMLWHRDNGFCAVTGVRSKVSSGGYVRVARAPSRQPPVASESSDFNSLHTGNAATMSLTASNSPSTALSAPASDASGAASAVPSAAAIAAATETGPRYVEYPRIDPAVIMLVSSGEHSLLGRKKEWPAGRYSTLAGFIEVGEALEMAVARETKEESGIDVDLKSVSYVGSQPWPFPRSLMVGFIAKAKAIPGGADPVKARLASAMAVLAATSPPTSSAASASVSRGEAPSPPSSSSKVATGTQWWPVSAAGRDAIRIQKIRSEEVEAVLLPPLLLPPPTPCPDEMQDVRWYHVETISAAVMAAASGYSSSSAPPSSSHRSPSPSGAGRSSTYKGKEAAADGQAETLPSMSDLADDAVATGPKPLIGEPPFHIPGHYALSHTLVIAWLAQHGLSKSRLHSGQAESSSSSSPAPTSAAKSSPCVLDSAKWAWRTGFPQVCLDKSGEYKYILMRISDSIGNSDLAVWGARSCGYHSDILVAARARGRALGLSVEPLGGGFVEHVKAAAAEAAAGGSSGSGSGGLLRLYGESGGFGPAPHELSAVLLRKWSPQLELAAPPPSAGGSCCAGEIAALREDGSVVLRMWSP